MHPVFKVYPYANKSKKIINRCVESDQNTEQTSFNPKKQFISSRTSHLKDKNPNTIITAPNIPAKD